MMRSRRVLVGAGLLLAGLTGGAHAACVAPNLASASANVDRFTSNPAGVLERAPGTEGALISELRGLVVSDARALNAAGTVVPGASAAQKAAIGAALGQATVICRRPDPEFARRIQEFVVRLNDAELTAAYNAATGDTRTTAIGGGAAGPGGGAGGGGGTGTGGSTGGGGNAGFFAGSTSSFANMSGSFTSGTGGTLVTNAAGAGTGTTFGVASEAVSPTTISATQ